VEKPGGGCFGKKRSRDGINGMKSTKLLLLLDDLRTVAKRKG